MAIAVNLSAINNKLYSKRLASTLAAQNREKHHFFVIKYEMIGFADEQVCFSN